MDDLNKMMQNPDAEARVDLTTDDDVVNPVVTETKGVNYKTVGSSIPADLKEDDIKVVGQSVSAAKLAKATGHQVSPEALAIEAEQPKEKKPKTGKFVPETETKPKEGSQRIMSPRQAAKEGIDVSKAESINIRDEVARRTQEQIKATREAEDNTLAGILQQSLNSEAARNERLENTVNADEATRAKLLGDTPIANATKKVTTEEERKKTDRQSSNPAIDPYDLMPSYEEEEPETPKVEEEEPDPTSEEYADFIKNLPTVSDAEPTKGYAATRIREANVTIVRTDPNKSINNLGNQAFANAVANFKRDNFSKVTVPLVNSGFMADVVGTGVVDLQNLYSTVDQSMSGYDYQLERMATIIRNVVGTNPKINPMQLKNSIHYQDYDMLAFAHICATLKTVETVANCTECGKPFHITSNPLNLLMNMDELYEKRTAIENAANVEENSLMTSSRIINTEAGIIITLSHPSYAELVRCIRGYKDFSQDMTDSDRKRFENLLDMLWMIRTIALPNGIKSNNIYQNYQALMLLSQNDFALVQREIESMRKDVIVPRFGIREVVCPHCGRTIKNIAYNNLDELLFFHLSVEAFLNQATQNKKNKDANGSESVTEA